MKILSLLISILYISLNLPVTSVSAETVPLYGPRVEYFDIAGEEVKSEDCSLFAVTTSSDTIKNLQINTTGTGESLSVEITDSGTLSYSGNTGTAKRNYAIYLSATKPSLSYSTIKTSDNKGNFSGSLKNSQIPSGVSYIWVYYDASGGYYSLPFERIPVIKSGSSVGIFKAEVTENNREKYYEFVGTDVEYYKSINEYCLSKSGVHYFDTYKAITDKAKEITAGKTTEYQKAQAIHNWIGENIYYDYDALESGDISDAANPRLAFETKKAVCSGYSRLMSIMLRSLGVACINITGYAYQFPQGYSWNDISHSGSNHEWNMFYDGEKWCIVDVTWDTTNRYQNGIFTKGRVNNTYFDADINYFSYTHKSNGTYSTQNSYYARLDYPAYDGVLYIRNEAGDNSTYTAYETYGNKEEYIIKDNVCGFPVTNIYPYFLFENENVKHVFIPKTITEIGYAAFYYCTELKQFEFLGNDLIIGDYVLYGCHDDLTVYAKYNSDLYNYARSEYINVKSIGKPRVSKIEKKNNSYEVYYTYVSRAPEEKIFCIVKDSSGNLAEVKVYNLDYTKDHIIFTPSTNGSFSAFIFDKTLEP